MKLKHTFLTFVGLALVSFGSTGHSHAGSLKQFTRTFTVDAIGFLNPRPVVVSVPTMGVVELLGCFGAPDFSLRTRLLSFEDAEPFFGIGTVTSSAPPAGVGPGTTGDQTAGMFQTGGGSPLIASSGDSFFGTVGHWEWSLWRDDGKNVQGATVSIDGWNDPQSGTCHFRATVLQNN